MRLGFRTIRGNKRRLDSFILFRVKESFYILKLERPEENLRRSLRLLGR